MRGEWSSPGEPIHPGEDKAGTQTDRQASSVDRHQSWARRPELISGGNTRRPSIDDLSVTWLSGRFADVAANLTQ